MVAAAAPFSFITVGDWGGASLHSFYNQTVYKVANQMKKTARQYEAKFILNTGDNFYWCGIQNQTDKQIQTDWVEPYADMNLKWFNTLGNHEYGYNVDAQLQMPKLFSNWVMDDRYYSRRMSLGADNFATFIFIDTSPCYKAYRSNNSSGWDPCGDAFPSCDPIHEGTCQFHENILSQDCTKQFNWFKKTLTQVHADDWLIVVGHHPADEINVEDFTGAMQTRGFDLYLNGHAHTLTQYAVDGNPAFVTSGAGAMLHTSDQDVQHIAVKVNGGSVQDAVGSGHSYRTVWYDKIAGFTVHTFSSDFLRLKTEFVSHQGEILHDFEVEKRK